MAKVPISVCIIAKNEEKYIEECLKRLKPYGMEIIVTDTGSTDRTKEIAEKYADRVYDFEWIDDFAAARNFCASKASYPWIWALDCDEYVSSINMKLLRICMQKAPRHCGVMRLKNLSYTDDGDTTYGSDDVIRFYNKHYYKYYYPIHEQICSVDESKIMDTVNGFIMPCEVIHHGYALNAEEMKIKQERNLNLLFKVIESGKADAYTYFQTGQSYLIMDKYDEAINYFEQGMKLGIDTNNVYVHIMITSLAKCYCFKKRYEDAINLLEEYGDRCKTAKYVYTQAAINLEAGNTLKALMYYIKTTAMPDTDTLGENLMHCYEHIINIYEAMGNQEMADLFQAKFAACKKEKERVLSS